MFPQGTTATLAILGAGIGHWLLAAIFALAVSHKLSAWPRFCAALAAYRVLPAALVKPAAVLVTLGELVAVCLLVLLQPAGALTAALLLLLYLLAIATNLLRGRTHIDCGCGDAPTPISGYLLARNMALVGLSVWLWSTAIPPAPVLLGSIWMLMSTAALTLLWLLCYITVDQVLANRGLHRRLWPPAAGVN